MHGTRRLAGMAKRRRRWFLQQWRKHRDLSQEELAAKVGLTQGMISHFETGESDYTGESLELLAKGLDCTVFQLLFVNPLTGEVDSAASEGVAAYEALPEREKRQAIEIMRGLKRVAE